MSLNILRSRAALNPTSIGQSTGTAKARLLSTSLQISNSYTPIATYQRDPLQITRKMSSSVPSTMKAIIIPEPGGPEKLQYTDSQPVPKLKDGEILVKNDFAGINFIDTYFRTGLYPAQFPLIIGQEAVGTIVAEEGSNSYGLKKGDKVVWIKQGSYAEYTSMPAEKAIKIPSGLSDEKAVGGFLMGMTAVSLVKEAYPVKKGETVLVHAAAGGMGLLMCQILRDIGVTTIGTAGGPEKCALAKENGATHVIDYRATSGPSWVDQVKEITNGKGVDVVFDSVGKDTWEGSLEVVKRKGKVVYFGNASGPVPPFNIQRLAAKNVSIMRSTLMNYIVERHELDSLANEVLNLINDGKLNVKIHKVYPLQEAEQAHRDLEGRKTTGKLLLKL